ncbi:type I-F CRISPR-associated endonuclease Cas1f [Alkalimonas mucilaginosa]|uniref:CRISPR-associated endonuclease Cas1 n=1 Tax=Alkalimonas mucilaginosa TaxID=3057676 RepID=A0ABU7JIF7_9GAMM|nr:type I-F CRISPR-associated endonuclease Cas1f [Alkalimonas sp. MEB004]MEE2025482.1 type I-F CRISPR-associated endonuclease Cas1f [Alkalimonas sp. MEB004]
MDNFSPSDLKSILHSKRANMYYLQHCRLLVKGGRVEYVTDEGKQSLYWNIPIANTTCLLLGTGTSVTQAAMRELARAGVLVGFCGGGGTPLFSVNDVEVEIAWFNPQSEYRPCEYLQQWLKFWPDDSKRLQAAKAIQQFRIDFTLKHWLKNKSFIDNGFVVSESELTSALSRFRQDADTAVGTQQLMLAEARLTKLLYKIACNSLAHDESFTRAKGGTGIDPANRFLDHGNYLAYGLGATATWVLGLPHGFSVLHGKTRRGGLVFDAADLIKDALVLPQAFISAMNGDDDQEFRQNCITNFQQAEALDYIIDCLKDIAGTHGGES